MLEISHPPPKRRQRCLAVRSRSCAKCVSHIRRSVVRRRLRCLQSTFSHFQRIRGRRTPKSSKSGPRGTGAYPNISNVAPNAEQLRREPRKREKNIYFGCFPSHFRSFSVILEHFPVVFSCCWTGVRRCRRSKIQQKCRKIGSASPYTHHNIRNFAPTAEKPRSNTEKSENIYFL